MLDELVKDSQARRELGGLSAMTFWRWDNKRATAPTNWQPPVKIGKRNFRKRSMLEAVKSNLQSPAS